MSKKTVWIFDVDGTLADCEHRRHLVQENPKDWKEFIRRAVDDIPNWPIVKLLRLLYANGDTIIIVTGRDYGDSAVVTIEWLKKYNIPYHRIYFRQAGDNREDSIVKGEILHEIYQEFDEVEGVFDDRKRVVDMWRSFGIPCFQVAEGNF